MNIIQRIFKRQPRSDQVQRIQLMSGNGIPFTAWNGDAYSSDIYRAAVDAIARNTAKLKGSHVIRTDLSLRIERNPKINRLLQVQPNPYMNAYDLLYKLVMHYFLYNNAFAYLQRDERGNVSGIYPIKASTVEFMADSAGALYCRFLFSSGKAAILPYVDVVHLRRNFNDNDLLGDDNSAIMPALELAHTQSQGIVNGIKSSASIRGILHFTQIMAADKLKDEKDRFITDYLSINNEGGVVATDQKMEYKPIDLKPATIDHEQMNAAKHKIYDYLGIAESIITSSYSEDEWAAFYESTIEPIALQLSLEFTRKVFTEREQAFGNTIQFESSRLQFSSNATKVNLIKELMPYGLLTINQALEILNLPAVQDGDRRLQTLNVVDADKAQQYQFGKEGTQ
ncbi:phage portal protein [Eubacteriales bacterium OttesenSCG-928-A19]|nr:phage portal protein [Eubacteriales bacterium OttesenSCG-928-A19]